jgi:serine/threonine protein phosphatase PrpC
VLLILHCTTAAVFDGHGGSTSAEWLQQHLYDDVLPKVNSQLLQPDPNAEPIPGRPGVTRSTRAEKFMVELFQQVDDELIAYLIGEQRAECLLGQGTGTAAAAYVAAGTRKEDMTM